MESKLKAARIAMKGGIGTVIASGRTCDLGRLFLGEEIGTFVLPSKRRIKGKKRWIAFSPKIAGRIVIDRGGERAIVTQKKSLLPAGVREVYGAFVLGSNVSIENEEHREVARGLSNFSSDEIRLIKGMNSRRIPELLGSDTYFEEVVHRDNMVILV
jgi:glutamate 5-kinase